MSDATLRKLLGVVGEPPVTLLSMLLGRPVSVKQTLPTNLITVQELLPDLLFLLDDDSILHLEVHGYWMVGFPVRNLLHWGVIYRDLGQPPRQIAIWIGRKKPGIRDGINMPPHLSYSYPVIDARTLDAEPLLASGHINEAIFAVLCKFRDSRRTVVRILRRIKQLPLAEQKEAVLQLLILSGLRGLTELVREEAKRMPLSIDIHENEFLDGIYKDARREGRQEGRRKGLEQGHRKGLEQGHRKGLEQGSQEGRLEGRLEAARGMLLDLLEQKFGSVTPATKLRVGSADLEQVTSWSRKVFSAKRIGEVFR